MTWSEDALCYGQDPGIWFEDEPTYDLETAREICGRCPVGVRCLADALEREKGAEARARAGVIAGTTPEERVKLAKPRVRSLTEPEHNERMRLYDAGLSDPEIGEKTGRPRHVIYDWRRRNKLPKNDQAGKARRMQWERLYREGYPDAVVAHLTQTTVAAVKSWRQRMGYQPNNARVSA